MDYLIISKWGNSIRIPSEAIPTLSRKSPCVTAMKLEYKDEIIAVLEVPKNNEGSILLVEVNGGAKKVKLSEWKNQIKGGLGIKSRQGILACAILVK